MKNRILHSKLLLLHHVATLGEDTLAREIYDVQQELNLPGLHLECRNFLVNTGVSDLKKYTPTQWKKFVKTEVLKANKVDILNLMKKPYKKLAIQIMFKKSFISNLT